MRIGLDVPEVMKVDVGLPLACWLLYPRNTVLVSCVSKTGRANIITLSWSMPVSHDPQIVAVSIAPKRYSHRLIEETGEFVVNIPTMAIVRQVLYCGSISGRKRDKFRDTGLTPLPAKKVRAPLIKECIAHLECKLSQQIRAGDHTLFIGEVVAACVNEGAFAETYDVRKVKPIYDVDGHKFLTVESETVVPSI